MGSIIVKIEIYINEIGGHYTIMVSFIQNFKIIFLIFTTIITVFYFIKDYKIGFNYYMFFVVLSGLFGFARPIFAGDVILPILIPLGVYAYYKHFNATRISFASLFILIYGIFLTLISKDATFKGVDTYFAFGFVILGFSNYFFDNEKSTLKAYAFLWLYVLARVIWLITYAGSSVFQLLDSSSYLGRDIVIETGIVNSVGNATVDPNYFSFTTGIGFLLSMLFFIYRNELYKHLKYKFFRKRSFLILILIIGLVEFWLSLRGLSRGAILAIIAAILTYLLLVRKFKTFAISTTLILISIIVFDDVINLFILRFTENQDASGRYEMWNSIYDLMLNDSTVLFGHGLNYSWWKYWEIGRLSYVSTHNSWITILLCVGLIGMILLVVVIANSVKKNYQANTPMSRIRLIMLVYFFVACFSIEPLITNIGWILFAISASFDDNLSINIQE